MCRIRSLALCSALLLGSWFLASAQSAPDQVGEPFLPSPAETLYHDDGSPESYQSVSDAMCEKMPVPSVTPYPFDIIAVLWNALDTSPFELHIWDDNGGGGLPGTSLFSRPVNPPSSGWFEIQISPSVTVPDGQVYVGCLTQVGIGFDETNPDYNEAYVDIGLGWEPFWWYGAYGDFLIRAIIEPAQPDSDVGVLAITSPDTLIEPNQPLQPEGRVKNFGRLDQDTFQVWCLIDSIDTAVYLDVDTVLALASGDSTTVLFPTWTPDGGGNVYQVTVYTALIGDQVSENDTLMDTTRTILHDAGVDSIVAPPDTVFTGFDYEPIAMVRNFGDVADTFDVTCKIGGYDDTVSVVSLPPGSAVPCTFGIWTAPWADSTTYTMTVRTRLAGDEDPSNDSLSKLILAYNPHDVGIDTILSPPDTVIPGPTYPVEVVVCNYGEVNADSFEVWCRIDAYLEVGSVYGLAPDSCLQVNFPDWMPAGAGPWIICSWTLLDHDRNLDNDTSCTTIYVGIQELPAFQFPVATFRLCQNAPNPFGHATAIPYSVPDPGYHPATPLGTGMRDARRKTHDTPHISLSVYDVAGRLVRTLVDGHKAPGFHTAAWDGRDGQGHPLAAGLYFYRLTVYPERSRGAGGPALPFGPEALRIEGSGAEVFTACRKMILFR